jgi:prepilin-type N-terminal cleavage/methylation domain-containing protein
VEWHEAVWQPVIVVRPHSCRRGIKPLPRRGLLPHPARRLNRNPNMKPKLISRRSPRSRFGFTLVELLVVIAIIGILASMTLAVIGKVSVKAKEKKAKLETQAIVNAIEAYDSAYGRLPVSGAIQNLAGAGDFTFGGSVIQNQALAVVSPLYTTNNDEVISILMDTTTNDLTHLAVNFNHVKNPRSNKFLTATTTGETTLPGVGPDGIYRDPWGSPYIISLDLNYDEQCRDAFYGLTAVANSANNNPGALGLITTTPGGALNNYQFHSKVMVWSAGADKKIDPFAAANVGVNKDNILSWQ